MLKLVWFHRYACIMSIGLGCLQYLFTAGVMSSAYFAFYAKLANTHTLVMRSYYNQVDWGELRLLTSVLKVEIDQLHTYVPLRTHTQSYLIYISDICSSKDLIYHNALLWFAFTELWTMYPGLSSTWFIQHLVCPAPGLPNTWFTQHLVYPTPGLSSTWFTQHLVYPAPG